MQRNELTVYKRIDLCGKSGDLLQYFDEAAAEKKVPQFEDLQKKSRVLFNRYGHPHAFESALLGKFPDVERTIPIGDTWVAPVLEDSSVQLKAKKKGKAKKSKKKAEDVTTELESDDNSNPFQGDQSLAQSCRFLYNTTLSREVIYATADADVGRVWEAIKVTDYVITQKLFADVHQQAYVTHFRLVNALQVHQLLAGDVMRSGIRVKPRVTRTLSCKLDHKPIRQAWALHRWR